MKYKTWDETEDVRSEAAMDNRTRLAVLAVIWSAIASATWLAWFLLPRHIIDAAPHKIVTICSGCGSEWTSLGPVAPKPITKCPNCPMSMEEFERLKEKVRRGEPL
jgi:hypothetical protein